MGKKITQYTNNVSSNPDTGSFFDLSEKIGASTSESRKWSISTFKTWVTAYCSIAWTNVTGKPTTVSGFGITDAVDTTGGTANYVAKFTDANTIEESIIRDDGAKIGIDTAPIAGIKINIASALEGGLQLVNSAGGFALYGVSSGLSLASNVSCGVTGIGTGSASNYGGSFGASGASGVVNTGSSSTASGGTINIGVYAFATGGTAYCFQGVDGTQTVAGRFLKNMTTDGRANWANITTADVSTSVQSVTSSATVTATSTNDLVKITAQAEALTLANPTGAFTEGQPLIIRIKDNGTARAISYGAKFRAIGVTLPTTTVISKTLYLGVIYNSTDDKFDVLGINQEA